MHIEGSSISCGVRRLVISDKENPSNDELVELIKSNKNGCAIVMTGIPSRRKDVIRLLLDNDFEQVKNPSRSEYTIPKDDSIVHGIAEIASLIMYHDHEPDDNSTKAERFVNDTVNANLTDMASLVMHHGNEIIGNLSFFIYYMNNKN